MRKLLFGLLLLQASVWGSLEVAAKPDDKATASPSGIVTSDAGFVARLPARVFILASTKEDKERLAKAIQALGPVPNTEFFVLPKDATRPTPTRQGAPIFPRGARPGEALIMGLISPNGEVTAVRCPSASQLELAVSAARAVAEWKFRPAKVKGEGVTVLFMQLIEFNIETY